MKNKVSDTIELSWSYEDVLTQAENDNVELTDDEAREILHNMKYNHDASIGINWEVISIYIENYKIKTGKVN